MKTPEPQENQLDLVYVRSLDPLVVARRARSTTQSPDEDFGCLLVYPGRHAIQFLRDVPAVLGTTHPAAPLLLDREIMQANSRLPILQSLRVFCCGCSAWVELKNLGVSGMCLSCRPPAHRDCSGCGRKVRTDQVVGEVCLRCLTISQVLLLGGQPFQPGGGGTP